MNTSHRLATLLGRLGQVGLSEERFARWMDELSNVKLGSSSEGLQPEIAIFDARSYDIESFESLNAGRFRLRPINASLSLATAASVAGCQMVCIFVNDTCDASVVEILAASGVKLIALRCAGYNNVDVEACVRHGISVVRVPAYSPHAVAEHTVALMLMLNRKLHLAYQRNRAGHFVIEGLTGFDMFGKTVGVVGTGKIGQCVCEIMCGFGCNVLAYDVEPDAGLQAKPGVSYVALDELFRLSDIITLHVPLFPSTKHIINADAIESMKPGVMLINTSRGGLVHTAALLDGLKSKRIGSAGLDVYEEEAGVFFHDISSLGLDDAQLARLMTFSNVVVTSHQGFLTKEALSNIAETTLKSVEEFLEGKRMSELTFAVVPNG